MKELTCYCQSCGKTVSLEEKTCSGCGAVLGNIQCPQCGFLAEPSKFSNGCPQCSYLQQKKEDSLVKNSKANNSSSPKNKTLVASLNKQRRHREAVEFSMFLNVFLIIFLTSCLVGGFLWISL